MSELKAFAVGDMDVYAAESAQAALDFANETHGGPEDTFEIDDVIELVDSDLDKEYPEFDENELATGGVVTVRQWLAEMTEPGWLCGSDW